MRMVWRWRPKGCGRMPLLDGLSRRWRGGHWRRKPPAMAFRIARPVLALPVRLVSGFRVYARTGGTGASEVCVNVRDVHDKPGTGHVHRLR